jgi:archaellin
VLRVSEGKERFTAKEAVIVLVAFVAGAAVISLVLFGWW